MSNKGAKSKNVPTPTTTHVRVAALTEQEQLLVNMLTPEERKQAIVTFARKKVRRVMEDIENGEDNEEEN